MGFSLIQFIHNIVVLSYNSHKQSALGLKPPCLLFYSNLLIFSRNGGVDVNVPFQFHMDGFTIVNIILKNKGVNRKQGYII